VGVGSRRFSNSGGEAASEQRNQLGNSHGGTEKAIEEEEEALRFVCLSVCLCLEIGIGLLRKKERDRARSWYVLGFLMGLP
jgi:hypothetical protein